MRRYNSTLSALRLHGSREAKVFAETLDRLFELDGARRQGVIDEVIAAATWHVENPKLGARRWVATTPTAEALFLALGFRSPCLDGFFVLEEAKTHVVLERLRLGIRALRAFSEAAVDHDGRHKFDTLLEAEPDLGAAGTATVMVVDSEGKVHRRRFVADDVLSTVFQWARLALGRPDIGITTVRCSTAPNCDFTIGDDQRTLHSLGMWPGATLHFAETPVEKKPPPPPRSSLQNKPKPSDIFKAVKAKRDLAFSQSRRTKTTSKPCAAPA